MSKTKTAAKTAAKTPAAKRASKPVERQRLTPESHAAAQAPAAAPTFVDALPNAHMAGAGTPPGTHPLIDPQGAGQDLVDAVTAAQANAGAKPRRRVSGPKDPIVAALPVSGDPSLEEQVEVDVPHFYQLLSDDHVMYKYKPGRQMMPVSHANHDYSRDNGVTIVDADEK